jgi:hypothetical protein
MNRTLAQALSYLGHPLLIVTYALLVLLAVNPFAFGVRQITDPRAFLLLLSVFGSTFLIPGFGVALMKPLGLIRSLEMQDKQERTGPFIITGVFYLWVFKNLASGGNTPVLFAEFMLGATIALFLAFFFNIFTKISIHATGMGGLTAMMILLLREWPGAVLSIPLFGGALQISLTLLLAAAIVFAGLVCTARLALGAHSLNEIYHGFAAGMVAVMVAAMLL